MCKYQNMLIIKLVFLKKNSSNWVKIDRFNISQKIGYSEDIGIHFARCKETIGIHSFL